MNESNDLQNDHSIESNKSSTPFDGPLGAPRDTPVASDILQDKPLPNPALWEEIVPQKADDGLPDNVKMAGALFIVHGACLVLNGFVWRDPTQGSSVDGTNLLRALLWFGATFLVAGGLFERRIWAWWFSTLVGGGIGVVNMLASIGNAVSRSLLRGDEPLQVNFFPPAIAVAGLVMLVSTALLLTPSAKAAFGITRENPTGLF